MLKRLQSAARSHKRNSEYQFWTHENHAIEIITHVFIYQKMAYIHENPVMSGLAEKAEDWIYSSQRNYRNLENILEIDVMVF